MCDAAPGIVYMLDRMGVPFNRTPEGLLDFRRFGGHALPPHRLRRRDDGPAAPLRARRAGAPLGDASTSRTTRATASPARRWSASSSSGTSSALVLDDDGHLPRHRRAGPEERWRSSAFPGDAVCLATGGCGIVFGKSTNSVINTGTAASAAYQQGACYANGEFIQVHPTAIPGADKLRLISESVRGEGGRVWVPRDAKEQRRGRDVPESERDYFLEEKYPGYGNLVPRDIASRELFKKCFHERQGVYNRESAQERERGLPRRHAHPGRDVCARSSRACSRSTRSSWARIRTPTRCGSSPPCTTRWAGCGWTSSARPNGSLVMGSPRNQATNIPGLYAVGEVDYQYHGANRLGANSLLSCIWGGMVTGPRHRDATARTWPRSSWDMPVVALRARREKREEKKYEAILAMDGDENAVRAARGARADDARRLHDRAAQRRRSTRCSRRSRRSTTRSKRVGVTDTRDGQDEPGRAVRPAPAEHDRPGARHRAGRAATATSRAARTSSPSSPSATTRSWLRTTLALHQGATNGTPDSRQVRARPRLRRSAASRCTSPTTVDISLVKPRARKYETAGAASAVARSGGAGKSAAPPPVAAPTSDGEGLTHGARQEGPPEGQAAGRPRRRRATGRSSRSPWQPHMNVISALMEIQKKPVTADGTKVDAGGVGVRRASKRCAARARWSSTAACGSRAARWSTRSRRTGRPSRSSR